MTAPLDCQGAVLTFTAAKPILTMNTFSLQNSYRPSLTLLFAAVMWGLAWLPLTRINALGVEGPQLTLIAFGAAALLLTPAMLRQRHQWRQHPIAVAVMFLLGGFANLGFSLSMIYGDVVRSMMLFYLSPVWALLGAAVFLGERIDTARWLGMLLALAGAFLVLGGPAVIDHPPSWIDLLALAAGFAYAMNNLACRAASGIGMSTKLGSLLCGCALLAGLWIIFGGASFQPLSVGAWSASIVFGLIWILIATLATQWALTHLEAGRAAIILVAELLTAVLSAALLSDSVVSSAVLVGGAMIFTATLLETRRS